MDYSIGGFCCCGDLEDLVCLFLASCYLCLLLCVSSVFLSSSVACVKLNLSEVQKSTDLSSTQNKQRLRPFNVPLSCH